MRNAASADYSNLLFTELTTASALCLLGVTIRLLECVPNVSEGSDQVQDT